MGEQASRTRGAFSGRPKRATKINEKFSPTLGTAQSLDTGENDEPAWRTKKSRPTIPETSGSPTQQPRQDHGHAGEIKQHSGASGPLATLLLLHLCHIFGTDDMEPGDAGPFLLSTQASQLLQGANGLQTSAQAVGGLPK